MADRESRCTALVFGPDRPPEFLGPCRVLWRPIMEPAPVEGVAEALLELSSWADSVVFTSPRAPRFLLIDAEGKNLVDRLIDFMHRVRVYVIGPKTRDVVRNLFGVEPSMPERYRGVDLAKYIVSHGARRVIGVRSPDALRDLVRVLVENGIGYVEVYSYIISVCEECIDAIKDEEVDYLVVTSPMMARILASHGITGKFIAIGPTTAETLIGYGIRPICVASLYSLEGVAECLSKMEGGV